MARTTPAVELEVGERTVRVSNPDKVYFAERGLTKLDVVQYFLSVGDGILGALRDRPTTLERWPSGVFEGAKLSTRMDNRGDAFYQKRVPQGAPDYVQTATITFPSGRTADEVAPTELAVVAYCANLGTLTFHPWPVRRAETDQPDQLRIDLDPQPGTDFSDAVRVSGRAAGTAEELGHGGPSRRRPAVAACTSTSRSSRAGRSWRPGGPSSRSAASWNAGCPSTSR